MVADAIVPKVVVVMPLVDTIEAVGLTVVISLIGAVKVVNS